MPDTVFREKIESQSEQPLPIGEKSSVIEHVEVEAPYTDYEFKNSHPYIVDHFELGEFWDKDKVYTQEATIIEEFLHNKIKDKKVANSVNSVKEYLKDLELTVGIKSYDPTTSKIAKILDYIKTMN